MRDNVLQEKSFAFAVRVVKMSQFLATKSQDHVISRQILRSGTSIGANVEEAIAAQSRKDFIHKLQVARKEARETHYWLRLLTATDMVQPNHTKSIIADVEELLKLLTSIIKTSSDTINEEQTPYGNTENENDQTDPSTSYPPFI